MWLNLAAVTISIFSLGVAGLALWLEFSRGRPRLTVKAWIGWDEETNEEYLCLRASTGSVGAEVSGLGVTIDGRDAAWLGPSTPQMVQPHSALVRSVALEDLYEKAPRRWDGRIERVFASLSNGKKFYAEVPDDVVASLRRWYGPKK